MRGHCWGYSASSSSPDVNVRGPVLLRPPHPSIRPHVGGKGSRDPPIIFVMERGPHWFPSAAAMPLMWGDPVAPPMAGSGQAPAPCASCARLWRSQGRGVYIKDNEGFLLPAGIHGGRVEGLLCTWQEQPGAVRAPISPPGSSISHMQEPLCSALTLYCTFM